MQQKMPNPDEQRAEKWLRLQGYSQIVFQVNDPPDFLVDGRSAIEVTRLEPPFQRDEIPFERAAEEVLNSFGPPSAHPGVVYVTCDIPQTRLPDRRTFKKELTQALSGKLLQGSFVSGEMFSLNCGVDVSLWPSTQSCGLQFELMDPSIGVSLIPDLAENIKRCICEKSDKVSKKNRVSLYNKWWLILIAHPPFSPNMTCAELQQLRNDIPSRGFWSRIIVVSAEDQNSYFEL